jgi:hypothetical protein
MSKLRCKIILETWYQETPTEYPLEILPEDFKSIDDALSFLAVNYESILDDYPVTGVNIKYV